ncbi:MAG: transcription termination factor Rho [Deltaproteobacteria bacterium]|nr:transcription termination factor Rho [Deltaproteobacteria bacterium]
MGKKDKDKKKKPIEKMTAKELRDEAKEIPEITGAHGLNKSELLAAIRKAKGIEDPNAKKSRSDATVRSVKIKIRDLKEKRTALHQEGNRKMADIYRRKISRLKKKTRQLA